jgi:hypothetical protein
MDEVTAVERQHRSALGAREGQDSGIRDPKVPLARLLGCQDIVTKAPQLFDDRVGEILVALELGHPSAFLIVPYRLVDRFRVLVVIGPGGLQVRLGQIGVVLEDALIWEAQTTPLHQAGHGVARVSDTRLAAADAGSFLDPTRPRRVIRRHHPLTPIIRERDR